MLKIIFGALFLTFLFVIIDSFLQRERITKIVGHMDGIDFIGETIFNPLKKIRIFFIFIFILVLLST